MAFSTTRIFHHKDKTITKIGDIMDIKPIDYQKILNENFIYIKHYALEKNTLERRRYAPVGAIIVGSKDTQLGARLLIAKKELSNNIKNKLKQAEPTSIKS